MSFIQDTIKCKKCNFEMNVSTGTFGGGIPRYCPDCKKFLEHEVISSGWNAKNKPKLDLNEIYTEPKKDKYEWLWWIALIIPMLYFIGHIIWAVVR